MRVDGVCRGGRRTKEKSRSVHEICSSGAGVGLFGLLKGELDPGQADEQDVEAVQEEGEEDEPEGPVVALAVSLVDEAALVEVEDDLSEVVQLDLRGEQNEDQAGAERADHVPEVKALGSMQRLIWAPESIVKEESTAHRGEDDEHRAEEDHAHVKTGWNHIHQVRKK